MFLLVNTLFYKYTVFIYESCIFPEQFTRYEITLHGDKNISYSGFFKANTWASKRMVIFHLISLALALVKDPICTNFLSEVLVLPFIPIFLLLMSQIFHFERLGRDA